MVLLADSFTYLLDAQTGIMAIAVYRAEDNIGPFHQTIQRLCSIMEVTVMVFKDSSHLLNEVSIESCELGYAAYNQYPFAAEVAF